MIIKRLLDALMSRQLCQFTFLLESNGGDHVSDRDTHVCAI